MRLIQHKREAFWFYRFLSLGYDRWVNPLFWTPAMRALALDAARLEPGLKVLDAGAGTGFTTEGIVARVDAADVTMLDQSPHQLHRSRAKPALAACRRVLGDAEQLPFEDDSFDRYVSAGSIEYWPDPQQGIAEAYRVTRAGGTALVIGPVRPANRFARWLAEAWMLFPPVSDYTGWMEAAGFTDVRVVELAPDWYRDERVPYALAVSGVAGAGASPAGRAAPAEEPAPSRVKFAARFVAGSAAGAAFVPIAAVLALRARREKRAAS
ncbi:methyltransferase domain-containing protein [Solirubrobacter sp. CPCC 204708]|uniref:Methyltransferase domain-containing protein n=1 Tax=Solirubrobacter deserti TaxID=2282478 RepID=A0ABT4RQX7_9ACTN|nr:methyltransferase domain-containing protein [Solirubrobacter deserti]MBE2320088.1 methyltransferase domain-containing protein [Solirubrobacter deserti]MDA0140973.1 methyltransferase domain-containing protein [Solirubrobacter deserti]